MNKAEVLETRTIYDGFIRLQEARLRHEMPGGEMSEERSRLAVVPKDVVAALVLLPSEKVVLQRQFRYPAWLQGVVSMPEIPAGGIDEGESPEDALRRELKEEIGLEGGYRTEPLVTYFSSAGILTEKVYLYRVETDADASNLAPQDESEGIELRITPLLEAQRMAREGEIQDAKTLLALLIESQR